MELSREVRNKLQRCGLPEWVLEQLSEKLQQAEQYEQECYHLKQENNILRNQLRRQSGGYNQYPRNEQQSGQGGYQNPGQGSQPQSHLIYPFIIPFFGENYRYPGDYPGSYQPNIRGRYDGGPYYGPETRRGSDSSNGRTGNEPSSRMARVVPHPEYDMLNPMYKHDNPEDPNQNV